jgi:hypothetical protein
MSEQMALDLLVPTATNGGAGAQPEMAVSADTANNGDGFRQPQPQTALPPGYMAEYQVDGPAGIPDALVMFKNRWGIPARLVIWSGCEYVSDNGIEVETSNLLRKGCVYVS